MAQQLHKLERVQIQTLLEIGKSIDDISVYLGRHRSTIYREMHRVEGYSKASYQAERFHTSARKHMARQIERGPSDELIVLIEKKILNEQWSPEQISNWLKINGHETISYSWIYRHVSKDKADGGELFNHLRKGSYSKGHRAYKGNIQDRVSIEERPEIVNERSRLGDYEMDLVVGPKNRGAILTIIDRASRHCILEKLENKSAEEVSKKAINALRFAAEQSFTMTTDNGTEFTDHKTIAKELDINYYFAHPYASYERGSIENLNGLIRQYIPKGTAFTDVDNKKLKNIQQKLNTRPRKVLEFLSPLEYHKKIRQLSQLKS
jgi:IS30 family transposase